MKMKRIMAFAVSVILLAACISGCGKKNDDASNIEANTVATKLQVQFREEIKDNKDIIAVADKLVDNNPVLGEVAMGSMGVEPGFLNGFNGDVMGFDNGVMFAPFIGTIPFVGYIFETSDTDALVKELNDKAMLNWNICTTADEKVVDVVDNYVFFVMAPNSFED